MKGIKLALTFTVFMFGLIGVAQTIPVQIVCAKKFDTFLGAVVDYELYTSKTSKVAINGKVVGRCLGYQELMVQNKGIIRLGPGSYTITISDTLPMGSSASARSVLQLPENLKLKQLAWFVKVEFNYSAAYLFDLGSKATVVI